MESMSCLGRSYYRSNRVPCVDMTLSSLKATSRPSHPKLMGGDLDSWMLVCKDIFSG